MTDALNPNRRSENMRQIRSTNTKPEIAVRKLVHGMGYRYRLHSPSLPGKPDLVFKRLMRIVEVRGCFWHQHGKCTDSHIPKSRIEYWGPKLKRNQERDAKNLEQLKALGYDILIVWECETKNLKFLKSRLQQFLNQ